MFLILQPQLPKYLPLKLITIPTGTFITPFKIDLMYVLRIRILLIPPNCCLPAVYINNIIYIVNDRDIGGRPIIIQIDPK